MRGACAGVVCASIVCAIKLYRDTAPELLAGVWLRQEFAACMTAAYYCR